MDEVEGGDIVREISSLDAIDALSGDERREELFSSSLNSGKASTAACSSGGIDNSIDIGIL